MQTNTLSRRERIIFAIPVIGWMLKDVVYGDDDNIWYFIATIVSCWLIATLMFGLPGLVLPAIVKAPLMIVVLILMLNGGGGKPARPGSVDN